jgi:NADH:ubiquinone oxidoreductase subunit F (NADH-binding)
MCNAVSSSPQTEARLLHGIDDAGGADASLRTHLARWGEIPSPEALLDEVQSSGLTGRGGAWFPVSTKWRGVAAGARRPVVVANGAEGEPASRKDRLLLTRAPHLVLDGLALSAAALGARRAVLYVHEAAEPAVRGALAERRTLRPLSVGLEVASAPGPYLAGQESAVVAALSGRRPVPSFTGIHSVRERGVGGRPTLVQNVETLAHVALLARFGSTWFRSVGTSDAPGTMLLTVTRGGTPRVVESALGGTLVGATGVGPDELASAQGVLLGGYGGAWVTTETFAGLSLSETPVRRAGATLGPGIVVLLDRDVCPLAEMADVVRFIQGQGAGQCGPCVHGLAELAESLEELAHGRSRGRGVERMLEACSLVTGRGGCRHPDGVARFVSSGLATFRREVTAHQRSGPCGRTRAPRCLPLPSPVRPSDGRPSDGISRLVSRS